MKLDFSKHTPLDSGDNVRGESRGGYHVWLLTNSHNEPKGTRKISSKISRVLIESFLKRPSLKPIAFEKLSELANDAVLSAQTPNFRVQCAMLLLALKGNKIKWARNGDVKLMHFADGEYVSGTDESASAPLGEGLHIPADVYETEILDNRDHYFVAFSAEGEATLSLKTAERCVRGADSAQDLLNSLLQAHVEKGGSDGISIYAIHLPPKKKKLSLLLLLIPVIAALGFFIVGALGKMRHGM